MAVTKGKALELSATEKMLLGLLQEKERNFQAALSEQVTAFSRQVEERLGLEAGAIGTTHTITASGEITETPDEQRPTNIRASEAR